MNNSDFFDDALLEKRIETFYGYGNYQGKYWFIGMEEAGGDFQDVNHRINIWANRGKKEIELHHWIYGQYSHIAYLRSRQTYEDYYLDMRINHIANRIREHKPKGVIFYGKLYEYYWRKITEKITSNDFELTSQGFLICRDSQTVFVIAKHPVAFGVTNEYFYSIGRAIAANQA
ncbi:hypothetical protein [Anabaena sp. CCY 9402-a]|uniref:hypothetical protein n=1 Tax=Anabaena sp. CCY 9402-a TaxID=3103867 RepID=UPI0039C71445